MKDSCNLRVVAKGREDVIEFVCALYTYGPCLFTFHDVLVDAAYIGNPLDHKTEWAHLKELTLSSSFWIAIHEKSVTTPKEGG